MLSREGIVHVGSGVPMADVCVTERRAPTSRWRVVVECRRSTIATTDGQQTARATDATAAPSVLNLDAAEEIRFGQVRQHRSQVRHETNAAWQLSPTASSW